jgi:hypothetical protein
MRKVLLAASLTLAFLAGCSSPPRESGYEVRMVRATERQEPWQNRAIHLAPFSPAGVAVVYVKLPQPLPEKGIRGFRPHLSGARRPAESQEATGPRSIPSGRVHGRRGNSDL